MAKKRELPSELGAIHIANEVVAIASALAAMEVKGVASMKGGIGSEISEATGRKNLARGVKGDINDLEAAIELQIIGQYGSNLQEVAQKVQKTVKKAVEEMTGLTVVQVNVYVPGIHIPQETTA